MSDLGKKWRVHGKEHGKNVHGKEILTERITMKTKKSAVPTMKWETGKRTGKILWCGWFYALQFKILEIL